MLLTSIPTTKRKIKTRLFWLRFEATSYEYHVLYCFIVFKFQGFGQANLVNVPIFATAPKRLVTSNVVKCYSKFKRATMIIALNFALQLSKIMIKRRSYFFLSFLQLKLSLSNIKFSPGVNPTNLCFPIFVIKLECL